MPLRIAGEQSTFPYHITAKTIGGDWFESDLVDVWRIYSRYLYFISFAFEVRIHAFVLMNNHFHLIISTPKSNISTAMLYFMRETSKCIVKPKKRHYLTYSAPHFRSLICHIDHFQNVYRYVYQNPVRAKICAQVENYRFSSLSAIIGHQALEFPIFDPLIFNWDFNEYLKWLNRVPEVAANEQIRRGLKRREFKLGVDRKTRSKFHFPR